MCGIAGFSGPWSDKLLEKMLDAMAYRGPDGRGAWRDSSASMALGHLRLSIIDLSPAGAQPMISRDARFVITFNGEIYNYRQIRQELEAAGVQFRSTSDTEVLLELVAREGEKCLSRLNGIFAFACWDRQSKRMLIARDQLGVKPFYYAELSDGFIFASELKALVLCPDMPREIEPTTVLNHLSYVWSSSDRTMLKAVRKLRPGHYAWIDENGRAEVRRFYAAPDPSPDRDASACHLLSLFDEVVADQMVADVPVGAFLSGGVDSSAIVSSMCRAAPPSHIVAFCAKVAKDKSRADNFGDDIAYARLLAKKTGVSLVEVPTDEELIDDLSSMLWDLDEPTADFAALQTRRLAAEARRQGIIVILSGTGGDDLFTGYGRHTAALVWHRLGLAPGLRKGAAALLELLPSSSLTGRRLSRMGGLLALPEREMLAEAMSFSTLHAAGRLALLSRGFSEGLTEKDAIGPLNAVIDRTEGQPVLERLLRLDLEGFLPDLNLNYTDKMAMRESIEVRVPFVDPRMVSFAARVPWNRKINLSNTKEIFRKAQAKRLPHSILTRPKQGFGTPVRAWLDGPARALLDDTTLPVALKQRGLFDPSAVSQLRLLFDAQEGDVAFSLFSMMAIELWCRELDGHHSVSRAEARVAA